MSINSKQDILPARRALRRLLKQTGALIDVDGFHPKANSKLYTERQVYSKQVSVENAYSMSTMLIESIGDHIFALLKTIKEPIESMAPFTCIRAALEASALASWMLDANIGSWERVKRTFAFRYDSLTEQLKFARCMNDVVRINKIQERINEVENDALKLGYDRVQNKNRKRIGIGMEMPSMTSLIKDVLNREWLYRVTSGMAHGSNWALMALSFFKTDVKNIVEKGSDTDSLYYLCCEGAHIFSYPVWNRVRLFGFDKDSYIRIFESVYRSLKIYEDKRLFWKHGV